MEHAQPRQRFLQARQWIDAIQPQVANIEATAGSCARHDRDDEIGRIAFQVFDCHTAGVSGPIANLLQRGNRL